MPFLSFKMNRGEQEKKRIQTCFSPILRGSFFWLSLGVFALDQSLFAANGFQPALPGYRFQFPRDHGSHPAYATEWWYYTGHLRARDGRKFGFQLTWFRTALAPAIRRQSKWATRDILFAHCALTDESNQKFLFSDRIGRANLGLAGAQSDGQLPRIFIGSWNLQFGGKTGDSQHLHAAAVSDQSATSGQNFALDLEQIALKPLTIQGERGVSQKSAGAGHASHYYSFTRLKTRGFLTLGTEKLAVEGQSWFDHEFGSDQMSQNQVGWDWFSLQLGDGRELMLYRLRLKGGQIEPLSSGTLIEKNGSSRHLRLADYRLTPLSTWKSSADGAVYPARWKIELPREKLSLEVTPTVADQELRPKRSGANLAYWEGSIRAVGTQNNRAVGGVGYLEMTGYASAFRNSF